LLKISAFYTPIALHNFVWLSE